MRAHPKCHLALRKPDSVVGAADADPLNNFLPVLQQELCVTVKEVIDGMSVQACKN